MKFPCTILYATIEQHIPVPEYEEDNVENSNSWSFTEEQVTHMEELQKKGDAVDIKKSNGDESHFSMLIDYKQSWIQNMSKSKPQNTFISDHFVNEMNVDDDSVTIVPSQETQVPTEYNNSPSPLSNLKNREDDDIEFLENRKAPGSSPILSSSGSSPVISRKSNPVVEHETCEWEQISLPRKKSEKSDIIKLQEFEDLNEKLFSRSDTASSWTSIKRKSSEMSPTKKIKDHDNELLKDEDNDIEDDWMDSDYNRKNKKLKQLTLFNLQSRDKDNKG
jgi:hypothetical protein